MTELSNRLHNSLTLQLEQQRAKSTNWEKEIENCFTIAMKVWKILQQKLEGFVFATDDEEIYFFKYIKPLFTSEVEYYNLLYHTRLFLPQNDPVQAQAFWERESRRFQRFKEEHQEFYRYYQSGFTNKDVDYFIRANSDLSNYALAKVYDLYEYATTSHDHLVASILALEKYDAALKLAPKWQELKAARAQLQQ